MKVGIDISQVVYGTGVSRYTKNLVEELLLLDGADRFVLFGGALRRQSEMREYLRSLKYSNSRKVFAPMSPRMADFIWNRVHRLHIEKLIGKVDVFHSSDWTQPPSRAFKVTTVHDLAPIKFPKLTHARIVETHRQRLEWVKKEVDRIIVPSESIKKDLIQMHFDKEKIRVIPEAADTMYKPIRKPEMELFKVKYNIKKNYLLVVGANARKNTERIIKAFQKIKKDVPIELFIVGNLPRGFMNGGICHAGLDPVSASYSGMGKRQIPGQARNDGGSGIRLLGHVPDHDMPAFYTGAAALVYPSLYEGFGLPILESFACKTPVVTSDIGSMAEIGKGAAVLVDPESVEAIVKGIRKVLLNRNDYILKGMKRVKEYSWKKAARETLEVYREGLEN